MQAVRTQVEVHAVDGRGVMKKVPENLNVSECISMRASECTACSSQNAKGLGIGGKGHEFQAIQPFTVWIWSR